MDNSNSAKKHIEKRIQELAPWHSPMDLGYGINTGDALRQRRFARRLKLLQIPENLSGKRVLDIGTWDGFFSWELEKQGADIFSIDQWDDKELEKFLWIRQLKGSKGQYKRMDCYNLDPASEGTFDLVLCAGLLYHLRYPLATLERIRKVCRGQLILETVCMIPAAHGNFPMIAFFPGDLEALASGRSWSISGAATASWIKEALLSAGFSRVKVIHKPSGSWWKRFSALISNHPQKGRIIVHAHV